MKHTPEQIHERFRKLPSEVKDIIGSDKLSTALQTITKNYSLHIDQGADLGYEINLALLGFTKPEELKGNLRAKLRISEERAQKIVRETEELIFKSIRKSMQKIYKKSDERPGSDGMFAPERATQKTTEARLETTTLQQKISPIKKEYAADPYREEVTTQDSRGKQPLTPHVVTPEIPMPEIPEKESVPKTKPVPSQRVAQNMQKEEKANVFEKHNREIEKPVQKQYAQSEEELRIEREKLRLARRDFVQASTEGERNEAENKLTEAESQTPLGKEEKLGDVIGARAKVSEPLSQSKPPQKIVEEAAISPEPKIVGGQPSEIKETPLEQKNTGAKNGAKTEEVSTDAPSSPTPAPPSNLPTGTPAGNIAAAKLSSGLMMPAEKKDIGIKKTSEKNVQKKDYSADPYREQIDTNARKELP